MSSQNIVESATKLLRSQIENNIAAALAEMQTDRDSTDTTTSPPVSYFYYTTAQAYRTPAVFIIADRVDFKKTRGANFVDATISFNINVVVEDRTEQYLTLKAWRYQDAMHKILDQQTLVATSPSLKIVCVIERAEFSPIYTKSGKDNLIFRKEIALECEVELYENF